MTTPATLMGIATRMPKAELHLHLEGTLEPELAFELAARNGVGLRFSSVEELRRAYDFDDLQSFLDVYYETAAVLRTRRDFYELTAAYLHRAAADGVTHVEPFFDPQTHTARGVGFPDVVAGIVSALRDGETEHGITWRLIMCFLRDHPAAEAMATLEAALPYRDVIAGVGLDSAEVGNPPEAFVEVYTRAREEGFSAVAHAGEEGTADDVRRTLDLLGVARIEHGVHAMDDPALVERLARDRVPLTVCPLSNVKLRVYDTLAEHPLKRMLEADIVATVNSDDPAYFGGYVAENYRACIRELGLSRDDLRTLARNSFEASFLPAAEKAAHLAHVEAFFSAIEEQDAKTG